MATGIRINYIRIPAVCFWMHIVLVSIRFYAKVLISIKFLQWKYPNAHTICILCDGGGSNACSHHIVKQALMKLASTIGVNIIMVHYPPYCSKYNPIEHCMFGPISRSWSGAPLLSIENARTRAEATVTKKGLSIIATINQRTYETKSPIEESYESNKSKRIIFDDELSKWNYLVKCCS